MALPIDVTDPGSVNVADQGFGRGAPAEVNEANVVAEQFASLSPTNADGDDGKPGLGVASTVNDPGSTNVEEGAVVGSGLPQRVSGDASRPGGVPTDVIENDVVDQVYGIGTPVNVNV